MSNSQLDMSPGLKRKVTSRELSLIIVHLEEALYAAGLLEDPWGKSVPGTEKLSKDGALGTPHI